MDADVTDSAGTPADPDHPAGDTPQGRSQEEPAPEGGAPEDRAPEGGAPEDKASEDRASEGGASEGGAPRGEAPDADTPDSDAPDAGAPQDSGTPQGTGAAGVQTWADHPKDGSASRRKRPWLRWAALGASFLVLVSAGAGWWLYKKLDGNITTDTSAAAELKVYEKERPTPVVMDAQNILLIGSDSRAGENSEYGRDDGGSQRSDTTILLHLAADRKSATAVSLPRDLMVEIPSCRTGDDKETRKR
ncbi:LytR family transcriptional regulator, partial [Streptomyces sp. SID8455]|nr:LytR family transcriptional regulator [Streptomyces sp. SID8455]